MTHVYSAMSTLLAMALFIEIHLVIHYPISTWWIPVFVFTLELIIKAGMAHRMTHILLRHNDSFYSVTSFSVFAMQKNDVNEGRTRD